jgi:hypothetical protein
MVEAVGNAPTAAILQGSPAPLCCPLFGARGPYRTGSFAFSARRNDLICHPGWSGQGESNPASERWQRPALPLSYGRDWWAGTELNRHRLCGAFTAPWARQCPACPRLVAGPRVERGSERLMRPPGPRVYLHQKGLRRRYIRGRRKFSPRGLNDTEFGGEPRTRISHLSVPSGFEAVPARLSG